MPRSPQLQIGGLFVINGASLFAPDGYQEEPVPVVGYNLRGEPIRQGYPTLTFTWSFMKQEHMSALMDVYDPRNPEVRVSFIDKTLGPERLIVYDGMMHEPVVGARQIVYYNNVSLKFTHLRQATAWIKPRAPVMTYTNNRTSSNQVRALYRNMQVEILDSPSAGWVIVDHPTQGSCYLEERHLDYQIASDRTVAYQPFDYPIHYTQGTVTVRNAPGGTALGTLFDNTQVDVLTMTASHAQIIHAGIPDYVGWVELGNLTQVKPNTIYKDIYYTTDVAWLSGNATVYASDSSSSTEVGELRDKTQVRILEQRSNWIRIQHFMIIDNKGWVPRTKLSFSRPNAIYDDDNYQDRWIDRRETAGTNARVYKRRDLNSKEIGQIDDDAKVVLLARYSNDWAKIRHSSIDEPNHVGFIRESLLTDENPN